MKQFLFFILYMPLFLQGQQKKGIDFKNDLTWKQLLSIARSEYKYIFVSVGSPQCQDCRLVANEVFTSKEVVEFMNDEFISIAVSLDTSSIITNDKKGYPVYDPTFQQQYKIKGAPVYLFFSPYGQLVLKGEKRKTANEFMLLSRQALDPADQYYTVLRNYAAGKKDYPLLAPAIFTALALGDKDTANALAVDYKTNYLDHLPDSELCTRNHIDFYNRFIHLENTGERLFRLCFNHRDLFDLETYAGNADRIVQYFINKEEIEDKIWKDNKVINKPDWEKLYEIIQRKYGDRYAPQVIAAAKINFYQRTEDWSAYADEINKQLRTNPPKPGAGLGSDSWTVNVYAWEIFLYCNDDNILRMALEWSNLSLQLDPTNIQYMDTKANILYKLDRREEAIEWEQKAINQGLTIAKWNEIKDKAFLDSYINKINKMKAGKPTWKQSINTF